MLHWKLKSPLQTADKFSTTRHRYPGQSVIVTVLKCLWIVYGESRLRFLQETVPSPWVTPQNPTSQHPPRNTTPATSGCALPWNPGATAMPLTTNKMFFLLSRTTSYTHKRKKKSTFCIPNDTHSFLKDRKDAGVPVLIIAVLIHWDNPLEKGMATHSSILA